MAIFFTPVQDGTLSQKGIVRLVDSISSTSVTEAATPNSVKASYDLAADALVLASQAALIGAQAFSDLYANTAGSPGGKIIDLGDLSSTCGSDYFTDESGGTPNYSCALGCSIIDLGTL